MAANPMVWIAAHKAVAAAGAGAVGLGLYARSKKTAAATGTATPVSTAAPTGATAGATYDSTAQDLYSSIEPQLGSLQAQIANLNAGGATAGTAAPPAATGPFNDAFGRSVWANDTAYAKLQGVNTSGLTAPSDYAGYGLTRFAQQEYALANPDKGTQNVPGSSGWTVNQALAENTAYMQGKLGAAALGATV